MNENNRSSLIATQTATGPAGGTSLVGRQYRVRKGTHTFNENVANSNAWGADLHIPLHSNALDNNPCFENNTNNSSWGTEAFWLQNNDKRCANILVARVGASSPGTHDVIKLRDDLAELKAAAPTCYSESEYHVWNRGVNFLQNSDNWAYKLAVTVDVFFDYPRAPIG